MSEYEILNGLVKNFPELIHNIYPFPATFTGNDKIKAIVLGADPTHIVNGEPEQLEKVFQLNKPKSSPYWRSMNTNIAQIANLSLDNLHVQNVCRNYFTKETSKNKDWVHIARNYWVEHLKEELDSKFDKEIPVFMTTEFILHSLLIDDYIKIKAKDIYQNCITIKKEDNLLARELIAFYRHPKYSLSNWNNYRDYISSKIKNY